MKKLMFVTSVASLVGGLMMGTAAIAVAEEAAAPTLSKEAFEKSNTIFFQRCTGCHGVLRKGATGKSLLPGPTTDAKGVVTAKGTIAMGTKDLTKIITLGTENGMVNFDETLSKQEIADMAVYLQMPVAVPPEMSLADMKKTHKVRVEPKDYPAKPAHDRNWENFFMVILRDAGKVGVIDGDKKEVVTRVDTGYAIHVLKESSEGRFWYTQGRDGRMNKIDVWANPPVSTAEARIAYEARDVAVSHYGEWKDKYVIGGGYWPPHFAILDGKTMEPLKVVSTRGTNINGEFVNEARVAAIYAPAMSPTWMVAVKELGQVWQVDYSDLDNLRVEKQNTHLMLHDGFFDPSGKYFQIAANASNRMEFVDTVTRKAVGSLETGVKPHPGPGANWNDDKCGPVGATVHLGEGKITAWGNDPKGRPDQAWKKCYDEKTGGPGLFIRTHPNSPYVFADQTLMPDPEVNQSVSVLDKKTGKVVKSLRVTQGEGMAAVHIEFNKDGSEVWVSAWNKKRPAAAAGDKAAIVSNTGEIVVYDSKTLAEKARIKGLETPTGKFNIYSRKNRVG
ncbi:MAG: nitrite reductase [Rhodospirillales bacterium RIFCSPLOWO2_12_FULL_58_28]|nr:MAG: nitrite reductase [Rhodospirillales bacterium RIFCSPLOWO2_02_FULL_58_16]OHC78178.1 MAG: nitrite reductase [Rhodospirillales bacterium RIFCSPLOWO2_12_FULL_58_28]